MRPAQDPLRTWFEYCWCEKCDAPVNFIEFTEDQLTRRLKFNLRCHGERTEFEIDYKTLLEGKPQRTYFFRNSLPKRLEKALGGAG